MKDTLPSKYSPLLQTYPAVLDTFKQFWKTYFVSLVVLLWLPLCPTLPQTVYLPFMVVLMLSARARSCTVPDQVNKVNHCLFISLPFCWMALHSSIHCIFDHTKKTSRAASERGKCGGMGVHSKGGSLRVMNGHVFTVINV